MQCKGSGCRAGAQGAVQVCRVQCRGSGCSAGMQGAVQGCRVQCRGARCSAGVQGASQASCLEDLIPTNTGSTGSGALVHVMSQACEVFSRPPLPSVLARQGLPLQASFAANGTSQNRRKEQSPQVALFALTPSQIHTPEPSLAAQSRALLPSHRGWKGEGPRGGCVG